MTSTPPDLSLAELALAVLRQHAAAFAEHACRAGSEDEDPEHVHQTRVATRRLRAAIRLFGDVLPTSSGELNDELAWIAGQLGPLRDLDVQVRRLREIATALGVGEELGSYADWLLEQRRASLAALDEALTSQRFTDLRGKLSGVSEWQPLTELDRPALEDGPRRLRRAYRRVRRCGDALHEHSAANELHRTRIRAKRLRYAVEFFESLYGKPAQRVVRRAVDLQDLLGDFQDGVVSGQRIHQAVETAGAGWPAETALALGRMVQWEVEHGRELRRRVPATYRDVKEAWKRLRRTL